MRVNLFFFLVTSCISAEGVRSANDSLVKTKWNDYLKIAKGILVSENPEKALLILQPLLEASLKFDQPDSSFIAEILFQKANLFMILNDPDRSITCYQSAMKLTRNIMHRARLEVNLGTAFFMKEDYKRAIMYFNHAYSILYESGNLSPSLCREISHNLGCTNFEDGNYHAALFWWKETGRIIRYNFPGDSIWNVRNQVNRANAAFRAGQWEMACGIYKDALRTSVILPVQYVPERILILKNLSRCYLSLNRADSAQFCIYQAKEIAENLMPHDTFLRVDLMHCQANLYRYRGMYGPASELFRSAMEVIGSAPCVSHPSGNFLSAILRFRIARDLAFGRYMQYCHETNLDRIFFDLAKESLEDAILEYKKLEQCQGNLYEMTREDDSIPVLYKRLMELTALEYQAGKHQNLAKFKELDTEMKSFENRSTDPRENPAREAYGGDVEQMDREINRRLFYINKKRLEFGPAGFITVPSLGKYHFALMQKHDSIRNLYRQNHGVSPVYTTPEVEANRALLEYIITDHWIITRIVTDNNDTIIGTRLEGNFSQNLALFKTSLINADQKGTRDAGSKLYTQLISPVLPFISSKNELTIIPDWSLRDIPFECLVKPAVEEETNSGRDKYLVMDYAVTYANRLEKPVLPSDTAQGGDGACIDYTYSFCGWAPDFIENRFTKSLHYAAKEVREIEFEFQSAGKQATGFFGLIADEASFMAMAQESRILHIATHSRSDPGSNELSGLLFSFQRKSTAADPLIDGVFELGELPGMKIRSELLVISTCGLNNELVPYQTGSGFHPDMFLNAGAEKVIYSLWNVTDRYTCQLMVSFYKHYLLGESFAMALRHAKLELVNDPYTAAPAIWGGFILKER